MVVNGHEATTHLSRLIDRAATNEEIIIGKAGKPMARLVPDREQRAPRRPGALLGRVRVAPDFDATPSDLLDAFEGAEE